MPWLLRQQHRGEGAAARKTATRQEAVPEQAGAAAAEDAAAEGVEGAMEGVSSPPPRTVSFFLCTISTPACSKTCLH